VPKKALKKLLPGLIVTAAVLVVAALCVKAFLVMKAKKGQEIEAVEPTPTNVEVEVVKAEAEMPDTLVLPAEVEPKQIVEVAAEVSGRIERIHFEEGETCEKGDLIVEINTDLLQAECDRAAAQAKYDENEYGRTKFLYEQGGDVTESELDQAISRMELSRATVATAKARLGRARILAPVGGILNSLPMDVGEYVLPGVVVAEIVDIDTVKVVVRVPESDVPFLATGEKAEVLAKVRGEEVDLSGVISYISELADEGTHSTRTEIVVDNRERVLRSGQIVQVRLTRRVLKDVIMVPLFAVIPLEEGKAVYVVEEAGSTTAERRDVELGVIKGRRVQVLSGLNPGDFLIVSGHRFVAPGQRVNIVGGR